MYYLNVSIHFYCIFVTTGCKVADFISDKVKRAQVITSLESCIAPSATDSPVSEIKNGKTLTLCVYDNGSVQILIPQIKTSKLC